MADRIVGIDFGTSTSAIRVRRYVDGKPDKPVPDAVMFNSTPVVPTLVQKQEDIHSAYYGYDAEVPKKRATVYQNFKLDLEHPDQAVREEAKALTAEYLKECLGKEYQHQSEAGFLGASDDTVTTFISYPVKWSEETCAFMIQAAKDAGFPNVQGLDEAQACIRAVTEQYANMLKAEGYFKANTPCTILLIDMGAGTTDLVLCRHTPGPEGKTEVLSTWPKKGEALFGGHTIDDILYTCITESFPDVRAVKRLSLDTFKTWKETVVSPTLWEGNTVNYFAALETIERDLDVDLQFEINREKFESLTGDYLKILPGMINDILADAHVRGNDIDLVILTGGHSQWYFVKEMLLGNMPQFGEISLDKIRKEPERIVSLARPQETVALGLVYKMVNVDALYERALMYYQAKNYDEAAKLFQQAANRNHVLAQFYIGVCYADGQGVQKDDTEAVKWFRKAAEQGLAAAQCNLGLSYAYGRGVQKDDTEAVKWYRKAAEQGNVCAQFFLGDCYENGIGVEKDEKEAVKWYRESAVNGNVDAQYWLGEHYSAKELYSQEAANWYRRAAKQGHAKAQYCLGNCYYAGFGVKKDYAEAKICYQKAAEQGNTDAKNSLKEIKVQEAREKLRTVTVLKAGWLSLQSGWNEAKKAFRDNRK